MRTPSSIAVVIISKGRPAVLKETLQGFSSQTLRPSQIITVITCDEDLPPADRPAFAEVYIGKPGTCIQRNDGWKRAAPDTDYVAFFDDDFELKADYLEKAVNFLDRFPGIAAITGEVLRDGDIERQEARQLLADFQEKETYQGNFIRDVKGAILYGCCMIIRRSLLDYEKFDENLPLYAFGEDYDISVRLKRYGFVGRYLQLVGVHLKYPGGRVNEVQRGYSMVANNWYFLQKGVSHLPRRAALVRFWVIVVVKPLLKALWLAARGDKSSNWMGRARGFLLAASDVLRGKSSPQRMLDFSQSP